MSELWLFLAALSVAYLLPGPDMILLLQTGARQGKALALTTAIGLGLARACHVALAGMGLATLFKVAPWTFDMVRLGGAAYLLWLGVQCLRANMLPSLETSQDAPSAHAWRAALQRGLLTNLLNPKALLFCAVAAVHQSASRLGDGAVCMVGRDSGGRGFRVRQLLRPGRGTYRTLAGAQSRSAAHAAMAVWQSFDRFCGTPHLCATRLSTQTTSRHLLYQRRV